MDKLEKLLETKRYLESDERVLEMEIGEWESRYIKVLKEINAEEKKETRVK